MLVDVPVRDKWSLDIIHDNLLIGDVDTVADKLGTEVHDSRFKRGNTPDETAMRSMEVTVEEGPGRP